MVKKEPASRQSGKAKKLIFTGKVFVLAGDLVEVHGQDKTATNVERWITAWGGRLNRDVTEETTHLICTLGDYKKKVPAVRKAMKMGTRCKIVTWDFIEECLLGKPVIFRVKSENFWQLEKAIKRERRGKKEAERNNGLYLEEMKQWGELADPRKYHIAWDSTFFQMNVILTRLGAGQAIVNREQEEKYTLYLFESNPLPRLYRFGIKYKRGSRPPSYIIHNDVEYPEAFEHFKKFFKQKTKIHWDQRLDNVVLSEEDKAEAFTYLPPSGGKPVGLLPATKTPPLLRLHPDVPSPPQPPVRAIKLKVSHGKIIPTSAAPSLDVDSALAAVLAPEVAPTAAAPTAPLRIPRLRVQKKADTPETTDSEEHSSKDSSSSSSSESDATDGSVGASGDHNLVDLTAISSSDTDTATETEVIADIEGESGSVAGGKGELSGDESEESWFSAVSVIDLTESVEGDGDGDAEGEKVMEVSQGSSGSNLSWHTALE